MSLNSNASRLEFNEFVQWVNDKREVTLRNKVLAKFKRYGILRPNLSQNENEKCAASFKKFYGSILSF